MSGYGAFISGFVPIDYHTESANTAIDETIQGRNGVRLALLNYSVVTSTTAHVLYIMYPGALAGCRTTASADAAASQKVLNVTDAPTDPAGNDVTTPDIIAYQLPTGVWEFNTVASLATKAITLTTNIAVAVKSGAQVRIFGVVADGASHQYVLTASVTNNSPAVPLVTVHPFVGDPIYVSIPNATAASKIYHMLFAYINK